MKDDSSQSHNKLSVTRNSSTQPENLQLLHKWALSLLIVSLIIHLLTFAEELLVPITYGFFLSSLLFLPTKALKLIRFPEILAAFITVSIFAALIAGTVYVSKDPAFDMATRIPDMLRSIKQEFVGVTSEMKVVASNAEEIKKAVEDVVQQGSRKESALVVVDEQQKNQSMAHIADAASTFVLSLVVAFFFLVGGDVLSRNIGSLYRHRADRINFYRFQRTLRETLAHYLMTVCAINTLFGLITGIILWWFEVNDYQILACGAALLRFIPFAGQIVTLAVLTTAVYSQTGDLSLVLVLLSVMATVIFIFGNLIDPIVHARNLKLNPIAIFLFLLFWGWVWGIAGVFVAIPTLVGFAVLCRFSKSLYPLYAVICVESRPPRAKVI